MDVKARPSRSSNKVGRIERNNGVFKTVVEKIQKAAGKASARAVLARSSFIAHIIRGNRTMSFQLEPGYDPSIMGIPRVIVTEDIVQAHVSMEATRAPEKTMRSRKNKNAICMLIKGSDILFYYKSPKMNEGIEWIKAIVEEAKQHMVICRGSEYGPPMKVAYEDVRLMPQGELSTQLEMMSNEETVVDDDCDNTTTASDVSENIERNLAESSNLTMNNKNRQRTYKDIGKKIVEPYDASGDLELDRQKVLKELQKSIGNWQVT